MLLTDIITDPARLISKTDIPLKYLSDGLKHTVGTADYLAFPISTEEVSSLLSYAHQHLIPVTPRGAGTNLTGAAISQNGGIIIDLSHMNHLLEIDKETLTATVEAGILLQDFQAAVESEKLFYPPDPGEKTASIGGNISTNAGGMRAVKYGVTRDYVAALEVVKADGTIITVGSKNRKDSSGLPLKQLFIGAEGTLGIITKATLKLLPKPLVSTSVLAAFASLSDAISCVHKLIINNSNPVSIEFIERSVVKLGEAYSKVTFPFSSAKAYLLLTYDGSSVDEVAIQIDQARQICQTSLIGFTSLNDKTQAATIWSVRGALVKAVEVFSEQEPLDIVVPINKITDFAAAVRKIEANNGVQIISFGHAGDGNVHLCVIRGNRTDADWQRDLHNVLEQLYNTSYALGGLPSGEHGIGITKRPFFFQVTSTENLELMRAIKTVFDPKHILNNNKVYL